MFKRQIWLENWNKIALGWWGNQPSFLIDKINAVRAPKSNLQKVIQSFLWFNSCRDSLVYVIYIMLFYESLIFVLSASSVSTKYDCQLSIIPPNLLWTIMWFWGGRVQMTINRIDIVMVIWLERHPHKMCYCSHFPLSYFNVAWSFGRSNNFTRLL